MDMVFSMWCMVMLGLALFASAGFVLDEVRLRRRVARRRVAALEAQLAAEAAWERGEWPSEPEQPEDFELEVRDCVPVESGS